MYDFFHCVADAVAEHGVRGLVGMVPGGEFAYNVAGSALKKYRQRREANKLREDMLAVAQASGEQAGRAAAEAARAALAGKGATPDEVAALEQYLKAVPDAVRQSLKRPADPSGKTVPSGFALNTADDVIKLLPARPPRFRAGDPLPGKDGWVLDRVLGVGGFGEVWLARHADMSALSGAVKFCLGDTGRELIHEARLIDRVMAAGRHPGLVPLTDCHLHGDAPWLMFEYVGGGTLADWIHTLAGKPPADRVKRVRTALAQLAGAVAHFHALTPPVVHRDLKPSNVLLDKSTSKLRVTDFGIGAVTARAVLQQEGRGQTSRGGVLLTGLRGSHTPVYASPQQRQGADPDPRDDVHALGVIGYQMLTGHLAQGAGPDFADDLREAGADDELVALLGQCVAAKSERRPATAADLQKQLQSLDAARPIPVAMPLGATSRNPVPPAAVPAPPEPPARPASPTARAVTTVPHASRLTDRPHEADEVADLRARLRAIDREVQRTDLSFRDWYGQKFASQPLPVQGVLWLFYGFLWIPVMYALTKDSVRQQMNEAADHERYRIRDRLAALTAEPPPPPAEPWFIP